MFKKSKIVLLAAVLVLAFAQVALPALTAVGPTNPANGFPLWYRDSLGQTVTLSVPPAAVSIPDAVIPGNAFSAQIGFGSEAMYWHSTAIIDPIPGGGQALLVLALEAAFAGGDAAPNDQIVFARVRIRIDAPIAGTYTVTHPYGSKTFTVAAADVGDRSINDTSDIGLTPFSAALQGQIGPFLVQTTPAPPAGTLGDATTLSPVANSPTGNNFFRIVGPAGFGTVQTNLFVTGAQLFPGTPFTITRATYSKTGGGAFAEIFATAPLPFTAGTRLAARVGNVDAFAAMTRSGNLFFAQVPFDGTVPAQAQVRGLTNGANRSILRQGLVDAVNITKAQYAMGTQTLTIAAVSSDAVGPITLRATGWAAAPPPGLALNAGGADTAFAGVAIPPVSVTVTSSRGGTATIPVTILP